MMHPLTLPLGRKYKYGHTKRRLRKGLRDANVLQHLFMSCVMEPPDTAIRLQLNGLYLNGDYLTPVVFSR
jgi:hypothetical protein